MRGIDQAADIAVGLVVAWPLGYLVVEWLIRILNRLCDLPPKPEGPAFPAWLLGLFERALAFVLVVAKRDQIAVVLIAWMAAKLAINWQRPVEQSAAQSEPERRIRGFITLIAGVVSLSFGILGGVIASGNFRCF